MPFASPYFHHSAVAVSLAQQLRQPRDVDGDPARFVLGQYLGLRWVITLSSRWPAGDLQ
jgi:hypothetical protein